MECYVAMRKAMHKVRQEPRSRQSRVARAPSSMTCSLTHTPPGPKVKECKRHTAGGAWPIMIDTLTRAHMPAKILVLQRASVPGAGTARQRNNTHITHLGTPVVAVTGVVTLTQLLSLIICMQCDLNCGCVYGKTGGAYSRAEVMML